MYIKVTDEWVNIIEDPEEIEDYGTENVFEVAQNGTVLPELKEQLVLAIASLGGRHSIGSDRSGNTRRSRLF